MAANYWTSTQRRYWLFSREQLAEIRREQEDRDRALIAKYPLPERRHLSIFFNQQLVKLGRRLNVRQQALATAQVYMRRYQLRADVRRANPYLLVAAALYLGCKAEECPQHIKTVAAEARALWPDAAPLLPPAVDLPSRLGEAEFRLIAALDAQLVVHHPYRALRAAERGLRASPDEFALAWAVVNDHYLTDAPLRFPLHVIAATAFVLAIALKPASGGSGGAGSSASASTSSSASSAAAAVAAAGGGASVAAWMAQVAAGGGQSAVGTGANDDDGTAAAQPAPATGSTGMPGPAPAARLMHLARWLAAGALDLGAVAECAAELLALYAAWEGYSERACREQIARIVKPLGLDK